MVTEMYEELAKRLRYLSGTDNLAEFDEAADAIEELSREVDIDNAAMTAMGAAIPRWIPVTERWPDGEVLALNNLKGSYGYHEYLIGYVGADGESDTGFCCENEDEILMNVTHWMPLPGPPKEET